MTKERQTRRRSPARSRRPRRRRRPPVPPASSSGHWLGAGRGGDGRRRQDDPAAPLRHRLRSGRRRRGVRPDDHPGRMGLREARARHPGRPGDGSGHPGHVGPMQDPLGIAPYGRTARPPTSRCTCPSRCWSSGTISRCSSPTSPREQPALVRGRHVDKDDGTEEEKGICGTRSRPEVPPSTVGTTAGGTPSSVACGTRLLYGIAVHGAGTSRSTRYRTGACASPCTSATTSRAW